MKQHRTALILMGVAILLASLSCKTRSYLKTSVSAKTTQQSSNHTDSTSKASTVKTDSSTTSSGSIEVKSASSDEVTQFLPDSGSKVTIAPDGTITGVFKSITSTKHTKSQSTKKDSSAVHNAIVQTSDDSIHKVSDTKQSSKTQRDSTYKSGKSNSTLSANIPWYYFAIGVLVIAIVGYIIYRFRSKLI